MELAVPLGYIFVISHALTDVANAPSGAGRRRYPPRRFIFSTSAPPTASHGTVFLASPGCYHVSPRLTLLPTIGSRRPVESAWRRWWRRWWR